MNFTGRKKLFLSAICVCTIFLHTNHIHAEELQPVRGVVKSGKEAVLSVELSARVIETPVKAGESFQKDELLIRFDCDALNAEKKAAKAALSVANTRHKNNLELQRYGAIGDIEVDVSNAQVQEARARSDVFIAQSKDCIIVAPYNGRVAELAVNNFENTSANQPLLKILGTDDLELRLIVPSSWLSWMKVGNSFYFDVDETGKRLTASVSQIGAEVDAVSKTVPITATFVDQPETVLPGMSGTASFEEKSS